MRATLSFLLLLAFAAPALPQAQAPAPAIDRIEITEVGLYRAEVTGSERAPGTATGARSVLSNIAHVTTTTTIEAKLGAHFGFRYRTEGRQQSRPVQLRAILIYPQPGVRNPATGNTIVRSEHALQVRLGQSSYRGYMFEHDWEAVPGTWTFELWEGDRKLASQSFEVVKPKD